MTFGEKFKQTLEQRNISQKQFAIKMKISESAVSDYVNYRRLPNILLVREFAKALDVSVDFLLDYESEDIALSPEENEIIKQFRSLTKEQQKMIKYLIETLSQK